MLSGDPSIIKRLQPLRRKGVGIEGHEWICGLVQLQTIVEREQPDEIVHVRDQSRPYCDGIINIDSYTGGVGQVTLPFFDSTGRPDFAVPEDIVEEIDDVNSKDC